MNLPLVSVQLLADLPMTSSGRGDAGVACCTIFWERSPFWRLMRPSSGLPGQRSAFVGPLQSSARVYVAHKRRLNIAPACSGSDALWKGDQLYRASALWYCRCRHRDRTCRHVHCYCSYGAATLMPRPDGQPSPPAASLRISSRTDRLAHLPVTADMPVQPLQLGATALSRLWMEPLSFAVVTSEPSARTCAVNRRLASKRTSPG